MPWFEYEGLTPGGTAIAGRVEATDREQAADDLADLRIDVRELSDAAAPPKRKAPLDETDLIFFNQQLASLAEADKSPKGPCYSFFFIIHSIFREFGCTHCRFRLLDQHPERLCHDFFVQWPNLTFSPST